MKSGLVNGVSEDGPSEKVRGIRRIDCRSAPSRRRPARHGPWCRRLNFRPASILRDLEHKTSSQWTKRKGRSASYGFGTHQKTSWSQAAQSATATSTASGAWRLRYSSRLRTWPIVVPSIQSRAILGHLSVCEASVARGMPARGRRLRDLRAGFVDTVPARGNTDRTYPRRHAR